MLEFRGSIQFPTILNKNGVAERKNKTIVEATRAMIYDQILSMSFSTLR